MLGTETIKTESASIIEMLKQLPKEKQEFISGYIQGLTDRLNDSSTNEKSA